MHPLPLRNKTNSFCGAVKYSAPFSVYGNSLFQIDMAIIEDDQRWLILSLDRMGHIQLE